MLLVASLAGCSSASDQPAIEIHVQADTLSVIQSFASWVPYAELSVVEAADPVAAAGGGAESGLNVAIVADLSCGECYRLERNGGGFVVHGGAPLGVQYGLAHLLELAGFRFFHPWYTEVPDQPQIGAAVVGFGIDMAPEKSRRGLHLHTIHPTEAYYAYWERGDERRADALRIADWVIKNRGNYVQWVGLDDIQTDPDAASAWRAHTGPLVDAMHARGLRTGLAIQLFGKSNLQQGFDLIDS
jgi:hypothetical protein